MHSLTTCCKRTARMLHQEANISTDQMLHQEASISTAPMLHWEARTE